jgi:hypothetical protein
MPGGDYERLEDMGWPLRFPYAWGIGRARAEFGLGIEGVEGEVAVAQSRLGTESGLGSGSDIDNSIAASSMLEDQPLTINLSRANSFRFCGGSSRKARWSCFPPMGEL